MSLRLREFKESTLKGCKTYGVYSGVICSFLDYRGCSIDKRRLLGYIKKHPLPKDETIYKADDIINDFTQAEGSVTFECKSDDTPGWILDMLNKLI